MRILFLLCSFFAFQLDAKCQFQPLKSFIPNNFTILDSASGNLNTDRFKDLVLILKYYNESDNADTTRPLLLLEGNNQGLYKVMARNDSVVLCKNCGGVFGDPYEGISIKNGSFSIEHRGGSRWRWTRIITFKFDKKLNQFILDRDAGVSYDSSNPNKKPVTEFYNKKDFGVLQFLKYSYEKSE